MKTEIIQNPNFGQDELAAFEQQARTLCALEGVDPDELPPGSLTPAWRSAAQSLLRFSRMLVALRTHAGQTQ